MFPRNGLIEVKGDFSISSGGKALTDCESSVLLFANYAENIQMALHVLFAYYNVHKSPNAGSATCSNKIFA